MLARNPSRFETHTLSCLVFGVIGDAMGTPTENLEPAEIEQRFGWVDSFEGDGTDDTILRDLLASALIRTGGYANADHWAEEWREQHQAIFGNKVGRFFPSVLHAAAKLRYGYAPRTIAEGTMPSSSSAMAIAPVGIVNAGNPRAAAAQAMEIASLIHVTDVAFCQDGAAAIAAAVAEALMPEATVTSVLEASTAYLKPWSGHEMSADRSRAASLPGKPATTSCSGSAITTNSVDGLPVTAAKRFRRHWRSLVSPTATRGGPPFTAPISDGHRYDSLHGGGHLRCVERHVTRKCEADRALARRNAARSGRSGFTPCGGCGYQAGE
jgi:hypothetical protein